MTKRDDDQSPGDYASPPCFMHEVDPHYMGISASADPQQRADVMRWREAEREKQIAARMSMDAATRRWHGEHIAALLEQAIGDVVGLTIGGYWPMRGEPDLRGLLERIAARGGQCALPVVAERGQPLVFRAWARGARLERGVWNIPVPAEGAEVTPDVVIAPVVAFDRACYRLGYGGGYFDRTLAAMARRPRAFGVGYACAAVPTIYPQPHDVPMDAIVTELGLIRPQRDGERLPT